MSKSDPDIRRLKDAIVDSSKTVASLADQAESISLICSEIISSLKAGNKIMTAGNGGSAAEAMHMSEELVGRFRNDRVSLPAISLSADGTVLTCVVNDYGYDKVFSRQVEGLASSGDVLVLFSTSGNSKNLLLALEEAHKKNVKVICLLGKTGGEMLGKGDFEIIVNSDVTERIQEAHQVILHLVLDLVELAFKD